MRAELRKVTGEIEAWADTARAEHENLVRKGMELFEEHGFTPYHDLFLDLVNDFKLHVMWSAVPESANQTMPSLWNEVQDWYHQAVNARGTPFMLLAVIRDTGPEYLGEKLDAFTPKAPADAPGFGV